MFNRDVAMSDPDNRLFTNIRPRSTTPVEDDYDYNLDDFGSQVYDDDLVMKVVFKKREISNDRLIMSTFVKYVTIDNYVELIDDIGIEYQDYSFAIEGREYLQKKLEGALDRD